MIHFLAWLFGIIISRIQGGATPSTTFYYTKFNLYMISVVKKTHEMLVAKAEILRFGCRVIRSSGRYATLVISAPTLIL